MVANYDMPGMRRELVALLAAILRKDSRFYREDYENIVRAVNRKTRRELLESLSRQRAANSVTPDEMRRHCQF